MSLEKALLLLEHDRPAEAEKELRGLLAEDPSNDRAFAHLARALTEQNRNAEALEAVSEAVHLDPEDDYNHFIMAHVFLKLKRNAEAKIAVQEAIRLNPYGASYYHVRAVLEYEEGKRDEALETLSTALAIAPEDEDLLTFRAMILNTLNRTDEAKDALESALRNAPNNPDSICQLGWSALRNGEIKKACDLFRDALRLDPTNESAQGGIVEALKAKFPVYRAILAFFLWMGSLSQQARWGIIIGLYVGFRAVAAVAKNVPESRPYAYTVLAIYLIFVFLTWTAAPLCNLFLWLHPLGKHALDRDQRTSSMLVGLLVLLSAGLAGTGLAMGHPGLLWAALGAVIYMIPVSGLFSSPEGVARKKLTFAVLGIGAVGLLSLFNILTGAGSSEMGYVFLIGCFFYSWIQNAVIMRR